MIIVAIYIYICFRYIYTIIKNEWCNNINKSKDIKYKYKEC
jgi:hypothetical protein